MMKRFRVYFISSITGKEQYDLFRSHSIDRMIKQAKQLYKNRYVRVEEDK